MAGKKTNAFILFECFCPEKNPERQSVRDKSQPSLADHE